MWWKIKKRHFTPASSSNLRGDLFWGKFHEQQHALGHSHEWIGYNWRSDIWLLMFLWWLVFFFTSVAIGLYGKPKLHFDICATGITQMINNPELYIESLSDMSWEHYIQEMSKGGTWCDNLNLIVQGVCNALNFIYHSYYWCQSRFSW